MVITCSYHTQPQMEYTWCQHEHCYSRHIHIIQAINPNHPKLVKYNNVVPTQYFYEIAQINHLFKDDMLMKLQLYILIISLAITKNLT